MNKPLLDKKEQIILGALVGGFALMGLAGGIMGGVTFAGIGLIIWLFWRGRKL